MVWIQTLVVRPYLFNAAAVSHTTTKCSVATCGDFHWQVLANKIDQDQRLPLEILDIWQSVTCDFSAHSFSNTSGISLE